MKFKVMFNFLLKQMYSDRRGKRTKTTPDKIFQAKDPLIKPPDKNSRELLRQNLYKELLSGFFVLGLLKIGGSRCVTYFREWVPGCVTKCARGEGVKLTKNSVTYFMDGPYIKCVL